MNDHGLDRKFIVFGTCGLHTVHNAFKASMLAKDTIVMRFLKALYNSFKESSACRGRSSKSTTLLFVATNSVLLDG